MKTMTKEERAKWRDLLRYERKSYDAMSALHSVAQHWVATEVLIEKSAEDEVERSGPKWNPQNDDERGEFFMERDMARYVHDNIMVPMHRYSCLVMLCTTTERELRRVVENLEKERGLQKLRVNDIREKSYMAQVAKFVKVFFGVEFAKCQHYGALCDLQIIRHCIIHCRGEVGLSRDGEYLVTLNKKRPGFFAHPKTDIKIGPDCIRHFIGQTWAFFTWVFGELKWTIDDHWRGDRLEKTLKELK